MSDVPSVRPSGAEASAAPDDVAIKTAALEALRIGVVIHAADTRVIWCNPSAAHYLGLSVRQMQGRDAMDPHWRLLDPDGRAMPVSDYPVSRVVRTGEPVIGQLLGVSDGTPSQQVRWLLVNANPVRRADGSLDSVVVDFADISARRELERTLEAERNKHRVMLRNASDALCIIDAQGRVEESSASWEAHLGCSHAQALGMLISDWEVQMDAQAVPGVVEALIARNQRVQFETRHRRLNGDIVDVEVSAVPFVYGGRSLLFCLTRNVSERKATQAALEQSRNALERLVAARTAELSAALQNAHDANSAKDAFLSSMSHELRTPLHAVLGYAQLLLASGPEGLATTQRAQAQQIEASAEHLLMLVSDLLDLARIESGELEVHVQAVDLQDAVDKVLATAAPLAQRLGVDLVPPDPAGRCWARGDPVRVQQCLTNLVTNAIKYNHRGGQVRLVLRHAQDGVAIDVADTGRGLSPAQQAHLFERFNRLGAESLGVEGCGIGLAITSGLMRQMQGRIAVVSEPGQGSTFSLWLPASAPPLPPPSVAPSDTPAPASGREPLQVLYVEDNEVNLALMQGMVALRPGVCLQVARSGAEAVAALRAHPVHLALLDMNLGDCHGGELIQTLRREVPDAGRVHIAVSADASRDQIAQALAQGFERYITKPVRLREMLGTLDEFALRLPQATAGQAQDKP